MIPRGIRNNNPGNIRETSGDATKWMGERASDDDSAFEEFQHAYYGIRALATVLLNYQRKYQLNTVSTIINRWAPSVENNTSAYIVYVANSMRVNSFTRLDLMNSDTLMSLVNAIMDHENGVINQSRSYWSRAYPTDMVHAACMAAITGQSLVDYDEVQKRWPLEITDRGIAIRLDKSKEPGTQPPAPVIDLNPPPQPESVEVKPVTLTNQTPTEAIMGPWVIPAIQAASEFIPELVRLFGSGSRVSERNARAAEVAVDMMQKVTQTTNPVDAVEKIKTDPALLSQYRIALQDQWAQLWGMVKEAEELEQASMDKAAARVSKFETITDMLPFLLVSTAQFFLTLMVMVGLGTLVIKAIDKSVDGTLPEWAMIVIGSLLIVIALEWRSILQYVIGTTQGSSAKNAIISKLGDRSK